VVRALPLRGGGDKNFFFLRFKRFSGNASSSFWYRYIWREGNTLGSEKGKVLGCGICYELRREVGGRSFTVYDRN
jgi:hypothetical protein